MDYERTITRYETNGQLNRKHAQSQAESVFSFYRKPCSDEPEFAEKIRSNEIDIFKGLLIILVVVGHYDSDIVHDVIFLFHMPLFFIISGLLLKKERLMEGTQYMKAKIQNLMFPYFIYLIIDLFLIRHDYAVGSIVRALWGGRAVPGVYWYITCFLFTLFLFSIMVKYLSEKATKCLILMGGQRFSNRIL